MEHRPAMNADGIGGWKRGLLSTFSKEEEENEEDEEEEEEDEDDDDDEVDGELVMSTAEPKCSSFIQASSLIDHLDSS